MCHNYWKYVRNQIDLINWSTILRFVARACRYFLGITYILWPYLRYTSTLKIDISRRYHTCMAQEKKLFSERSDLTPSFVFCCEIVLSAYMLNGLCEVLWCPIWFSVEKTMFSSSLHFDLWYFCLLLICTDR